MLRKTIVILLTVTSAAALLWWLSLSNDPVVFTIEKGSSARQAAGILRNSNLISSRFAFLAVLKLTGQANEIKAGTYSLSPRASIFEVASVVTAGRTVREKVTIPEGLTVRQTAELLSSRGVVKEDVFVKAAELRKLEGYLFPETYFFETGASEEQIIQAMLDQFNRHFTDEMKMRAKELKLTIKQIVTLASIVEKEAARAEERPLIAGVFHNRLKKGWFLESCASIQFALPAHKERLTNKDLQVRSPYNTYRNYGLPPGPICSPGRDSLMAALYPAQTEDMFFVVSGQGTHTFSRYYTEHLKNKQINRKKK